MKKPVTSPLPQSMNTLFVLLAQYGMRPTITVDELCRDYFTHLTVEKFLRKVSLGEIGIPLLRMEDSQKSMKGVHLLDLAAYIDSRRALAVKEYSQMHG